MSRPVGVHDVEVAARAVRFVARRLAPASMSLDDCEAALAEAAAIESMGSTMVALLSARLASGEAHRGTSAPSAEAHIARITGGTTATAKAAVETGKRLSGLAATSAMARDGRLSTGQTQAIADAAHVNPEAEGYLLSAAPGLTLGQLRDRCAKAKADADPNPEATRKRLRRGRSGRRYGTLDGFQHLHMQSAPEDLAEVDATLTPIIDELFVMGRRAGRRERREAYFVDAVVEMARRARGASSTGKTTVTYTAIIRADLSALVNGRAGAGEMCEIAGIGPVPVSTARRLLGDAVLKLVLTHGVEVRNVTSLGRGPSAAQKVALLWEQPTCAVEHCGRRARLEADHVYGAEFAKTKHTRVDELDRLCEQHHDKETRHNWALVPGTGVRPMVPPSDARHPSHARAP
jgi:hypothetical protein